MSMEDVNPAEGKTPEGQAEESKRRIEIMAQATGVMEFPLTDEDLKEIDQIFSSDINKTKVVGEVSGQEITIKREQWLALRDYAQKMMQWQAARPEIPADKMEAYQEWLKKEPPDGSKEPGVGDGDREVDAWYEEAEKLGLKDIDRYFSDEPHAPAFIKEAARRKQEREQAQKKTAEVTAEAAAQSKQTDPAPVKDPEGGPEGDRNPAVTPDRTDSPAQSEAVDGTKVERPKTVEELLADKKARIQKLEDAKKTGSLSREYGFSSDYMDQANAEVVRLEQEIHDLEKKQRGEQKEEPQEPFFPDDDQPDYRGFNQDDEPDYEDKKPEEKEPFTPDDGQPEWRAFDQDGDDHDNSKGPEQPKPEPEKARRRIGVVETNLVEQHARDVAEDRLNANKEELKGVKGFFKRIWKYNWAYEYYRQKEIKKVKGEIAAAGSVYGADAFKSGQDADWSQTEDGKTKQAILDRFMADNPDMVHDLAGESKTEGERRNQIGEGYLQQLIKDYAIGMYDDASFTEQRNRIFKDQLGMNVDDPQSLAVSGELLQLAQEAKRAIDSGKALSDLDVDFELVIGRAKTGARTEAEMHAVDHLVDYVKSSSVGRFVNETTVAAAYALTVGWAQRAARSKAAAWMTFGGSALVGGAIMGGTENMRLKRERAQMERQDTAGREIAPEGAKRRQEMSKFMIEKANAQDLLGNLTSNLYELNPDGSQEIKDLSATEFAQVTAALADIESRIRVSDLAKSDLIRYSQLENIEVERMTLDVERARAKVALGKMFDAHKAALGFNTFEEYLAGMSGTFENALTRESSDLKTKQRQFEKFKRRKVAGAAIKGVLVGLTVGAVVQETTALFNPGQEGLVEHGLHQAFGHEAVGAHNFTALEALRRYISGGFERASGNMDHHLFAVGQGAYFKLPNGVMEMAPNHHGGFDLMDMSDAAHPHILIAGVADGHGNFSAESLKAMHEAGIDTHVQHCSVSHTVTEHRVGAPQTEEVEVSPDQYIADHGGHIMEVHRDWPIDADSPNHLGIGDPTLDSNGNIVINLHMSADGSVMADGSHIDPLQAASEGKFHLFFTDDQAHQAFPAEMTVDPNQPVVITPDNPIYQAFKVDEATHQITGGPRFIEAGVVTGEAERGGQHVIVVATQEGAGGNMVDLTETVKTPGVIEDIQRNIEHPIRITSLDLKGDDYELPQWVIPISGRSPLEKAGDGEQPKAESKPVEGGKSGLAAEDDIIDVEFKKTSETPSVSDPSHQIEYQPQPAAARAEEPKSDPDFETEVNKEVLGYKIGQEVDLARSSGYVESGWTIRAYLKPSLLKPGRFIVTKMIDGKAHSKFVTPDELNGIKDALMDSKKAEVDFSSAKDLAGLYDLIRQKKVVTNVSGDRILAEKVIEFIEVGAFAAVTSQGGLREIAMRLRKEAREQFKKR